jgi:hypothetical protein
MIMGPDILMGAIAFFLGGFVGRLVAGPRPAAGRIGILIIASLVAWSVIGRFLPQLQWGREYVPGKGWVPMTPHIDVPPPDQLLILPTVLMSLGLLVFGVVFAGLGDWVAIRLVALPGRAKV